MRKVWIAAIAFGISAIVGVALSLAIAMAVAFLRVFLFQRSHTGIGVVVGGLSQTAVVLLPILWGTIGILIVLRRIERSEP